jgi:hypothetical protein
MKNNNKRFTLFLLSDQCVTYVTADNDILFVRRDRLGVQYEVDRYGEIIYQTLNEVKDRSYYENLNKVKDRSYYEILNKKVDDVELLNVRFEPLTFLNYTSTTLCSLKLKKNYILNKFINIINSTQEKKNLKSIKFLEFHRFLMVLIGNIPPVSLLEKNADINLNFYETPFFEININLVTGKKKKEREYPFDFSKPMSHPVNSSRKKVYDIDTSTPYFFSYLEIEIILDKIYPNAHENEILQMRAHFTSKLKTLGFLLDRRRFSVKNLPSEFQAKLIHNGRYTVQNGDIISYGFFGIRLLTKVF